MEYIFGILGLLQLWQNVFADVVSCSKATKGSSKDDNVASLGHVVVFWWIE